MVRKHRLGLYRLFLGVVWLMLALNHTERDWILVALLVVAFGNLIYGSHLFLGEDE